MAKKRAMTSEDASLKKRRGHLMEKRFAELIGGAVNAGNPASKKDVIDRRHNSHSVKSGTYWQIFLYRRSRLQTNTVLQGLGDISRLMVACIDAMPANYEAYRANKPIHKARLREPMRRLCAELQKPNIRRAFYDRVMFNAGEVDYLSVESGEEWHIFPSRFVVDFLETLEITNSKARKSGETDDQKVLVKDRINIGEIELRTDSKQHFAEMKFRINGKLLLPRLIERAGGEAKVLDLENKKTLYGNARNTFKLV